MLEQHLSDLLAEAVSVRSRTRRARIIRRSIAKTIYAIKMRDQELAALLGTAGE